MKMAIVCDREIRNIKDSSFFKCDEHNCNVQLSDDNFAPHDCLLLYAGH